MRLTKIQAINLLSLAGFSVVKTWDLMNQYLPLSYTEDVLNNPWFLIKTEHGLIEIGSRKRVIHIDWSDTGLEVTNHREIVGNDSTTFERVYVHAWNMVDALKYLTNLKSLLDNRAINK